MNDWLTIYCDLTCVAHEFPSLIDISSVWRGQRLFQLNHNWNFSAIEASPWYPVNLVGLWSTNLAHLKTANLRSPRPRIHKKSKTGFPGQFRSDPNFIDVFLSYMIGPKKVVYNRLGFKFNISFDCKRLRWWEQETVSKARATTAQK